MAIADRPRRLRPRPKVPTHRFILNFPLPLAKQVIDIAGRERRPISTQIQVLVERQLAQERAAAV